MGIIFYNSDQQVVSLNLKPTKLVEHQDIIFSGSNTRKPFIWQQNNIKWMCNRENVPLVFKIPEVTSDLNVYRINSVNEYIVFKRSKHFRSYNSSTIKIKNIQDLNHKEIKLQGGILADQVGLGKTYSMIGLMEVMPKLTLILTPGRLCKQIKEEIDTYSNLKSWIVADIRQYKYFEEKKDNYNTIICPISILTNKKCIDHDGGIHQRKWPRVIIDEAHEFFGNIGRAKKRVDTRNNLLNIDSNFTWLMTGTPTNSRLAWLDYINIICKSQLQLDVFHTLRTQLPDVIQQMIQKKYQG